MVAARLFYQFDSIRVEPGELRAYRAGRAVPLEPKAFQVLIYLLSRAGELVDKDEVIDAVWKGSFVTPNVLSRAVAQLRQALGDSARSPRYIETVPTVGYRFVAEVETSDPHRAAPDVHERTLAVLPFVVAGTDPSDTYIGFGLADSLISRLSRHKGLAVRPASSVSRYVNGHCDSLAAGRELKVESVIEGSIMRVSNRVRANVRFVEVAQEKTLWAESFDEKFEEIFQMIDSMADRITGSLVPEIGCQASVRPQPTANLAAYQFCLKGNYHLYKFGPGDHAKALDLYHRAIDLDPGYALAYAGLANAYMIAATAGDESFAERSEMAARKAVELDPALSEAHTALAVTQFWFRAESDDADFNFRQALSIAPNSASTLHYYAWFLTAVGKTDEAVKCLARALELDPLSPATNVDQGLPHYFSRRFEPAIRKYEEAISFSPDYWYGRMRLAEALEAAGRLDESHLQIENALKGSANSLTLKAYLARNLALRGESNNVRRMLDEMAASTGRQTPSNYFRALVQVALGDEAAAIRCLRRAEDRREKWLGWIAVDPRLDPLRDNRKFKEILSRRGLGA